ncbi:MAG: formylglycine-generating enzyme family protein [Spirochaetaceae bacterium]|jgi:formylglycine-generating enzyme required for sulfatase activity|nr:formylglycine-generating enzyme family protein [Spirochaetaceae bacterium]
MLKYSVVISISILQVAILLGAVCRPVFAEEADSFVLVPSGTFTIGSPSSEAGHKRDESQHTVAISSPFFMGRYEVTVGEFRRFVEETDYKTRSSDYGIVWTGRNWESVGGANWDNPNFDQKDDQPVVLVSWYDAIAYANWLSAKEGLTAAYSIDGANVTWNRDANGYRLPTEAEWEYAARAGTSTAYSTGDTLEANQAHFNSTKKPVTGTIAVGRFPPNSWGLYDMIGNAREWTWDGYGTYQSGDLLDPEGSTSSRFRVTRGGSWIDLLSSVRSAHRFLSTPETRISSVGFRLVRPASADELAAAQRPSDIKTSYLFDAELSAGGKVNLDFASIDNYALVYVNIERDGLYRFNAKNVNGVDLDTYIALYDANEYYLASDDDSGEGLDASLSIPLRAGEYGIIIVYFNKEKLTDSSFVLSLTDITDEVVGAAPELRSGGNISEEFATINDFALVRLRIDRAGSYRINAKNTKGADLDTFIALYDANRNYLGADDDSGDGSDAMLTATLERGVYFVFAGYVGVDQFTDGSYELSLTEVTAGRTSTERPENKVQSINTVPEEALVLSFADADEYRIHLTIEQEAWYQISAENLSSDANFDADLLLVYDDEWTYTTEDGYINVLLAPGEYTLSFSYNGKDTSRENTAYLFYVSEENDEDIAQGNITIDDLITWSAEIAPGEPVELGFINADDENYVRLLIDHAGIYEIRARNANGVELDTYIELYDLGVDIVATDDDGGDNLDACLRVSLEPGEYGIRLICFSEDPLKDGSFLLTVEEVSGAVNNTDEKIWSAQIAPGKPVALSFADADDIHFVRLSIDHKAWYQISAKNLNGVDLDTYIELFAYNGIFVDINQGDFIDSDDDGGDGFDARLTLPLEAGNYVVFLQCFDEDPLKDGSFLLMVEEVGGTSASYEAVSAKRIAVGETQKRILADESDLDWVNLNITENGRYRIRARSTNGVDLDTVIVLYNALNTDNFLYDDDGGDSLDAMLEADLDFGEYFIGIGSAEGAENYSYALSVEAL